MYKKFLQTSLVLIWGSFIVGMDQPLTQETPSTRSQDHTVHAEQQVELRSAIAKLTTTKEEYKQIMVQFNRHHAIDNRTSLRFYGIFSGLKRVIESMQNTLQKQTALLTGPLEYGGFGAHGALRTRRYQIVIRDAALDRFMTAFTERKTGQSANAESEERNNAIRAAEVTFKGAGSGG